MTEFVRVRAENGSEISVPIAVAEGAGLKPLKQSPYNPDGSIRPEKHRVPRGAGAAATPLAEADASPVQED